MAGAGKLVIIAGPTATGKSALARTLAKKLNGEIISADSMQVYRGFDIGTAKESPLERSVVPHHLIDILDPEEEFNMYLFQKLCKESMQYIWNRGKIPFIVGGTGFYIQSVLYDINLSPEASSGEYRRELEQELSRDEELAPNRLHEMLDLVDPVSAVNIPAANTRRVIRALDYYHQTGLPISEHNRLQAQRGAAYDFRYFVLDDERQHLYASINQRVDRMIEAGLPMEVRGLLDAGCSEDAPAMKGIGYKEMVEYIDGRCTLEEATESIKLATRHYAKRQCTWYRREKQREPRIEFIYEPDYDYDRERICGQLEAMM